MAAPWRYPKGGDKLAAPAKGGWLRGRPLARARGARPNHRLRWLRAIDGNLADTAQRHLERISHRRFGNNVKVETEVDDGLRNLRPDAADDAFGRP